MYKRYLKIFIQFMVKRKLETVSQETSTAWMSSTTIIPKEHLVIAKAKIEACEQFFEAAVNEPQKVHILLLQGPTCSGKTALVKSVCAHLKLNLVQVDELIDNDYIVFEDGQRHQHHHNQVMQTCLQNSKFPALALFNNRGDPLTNNTRNGVKVTFIDDIDSIPDPSHICKTLKRATSGIFVLTCADWFAVCKWCRAFRDLKLTIELQLNTLAVTFMQRAIRYWGFEPSVIPHHLIESGDLRACLHHAYLKRLTTEHALNDQHNDQNLSMFHALGRLFYPLKNKSDQWTPFIPDDRHLFLLYIHHNMFPFMASLDEAATVLEALSADDHDRGLLPLVECTLTRIVNREGRLANKVRPGFTRPEYLDVLSKCKRL